MATPKDRPKSFDEMVSALDQSEARYSSLIQRAGYGLYRSSPDGRFLEANAALATMLGYEDVKALLALDLPRDVYLDPDERERLILMRSPEGEVPEWIDTRWKRRDGSPLHVRISVCPH